MDKLTLKAARVQAGLTQTEAAAKIGISTTTLSNYEKGKNSPKLTTLHIICKLYKVSPHEIDC